MAKISFYMALIPAILLVCWIIRGIRNVYWIDIIQKQMTKNPTVGKLLLLEHQFQEIPTMVMTVKGCTEIVYREDGVLRSSYLVYRGGIFTYRDAVLRLAKEMKNHPAFNTNTPTHGQKES